MARLYLQVEIHVRRHPKVLALVEELQLPDDIGPDLVVGFLERWWGYCAEFGSNGKPADCPRTILVDCARAMLGHSSNPLTPELSQLLRKHRLMDQHGRPWDWQDFTGNLLARRARDAERHRNVRGRSTENARTVQTDSSLVSLASSNLDASKPGEEAEKKPSVALVVQSPAEVAVIEKAQRRQVKADALRLAVEIVFRYWRDAMGLDPKRTILTGKREARISARLQENGVDVSELLYCVDGALLDDWTMGRDPKSTKAYNGTETIFRDREKVESLLALVTDRQEEHPHLERLAAS